MSSVPIAPSPQAARAIAQYLLEAGYAELQLKTLGFTQTPWKGSALRPLLPYKVPDHSPLNLLLRLFFFGEDLSIALVSGVFPPAVLENFLSSGMLFLHAEHLIPTCMLVHSGDLLIACDSVRRARQDSRADLVLGVNLPTQILSKCMLPAAADADVLDLGTGCGTLALHCSPHIRRVTGTDINERALQFALFNAALNGNNTLTTRLGDRFEPVSGETFDLIISNPPFFLTPASKLLFTDNSFTLDSFVESIARQAPGHLREGGYFQMLCEWIEMEGQPWPERVGGWLQGSRCDTLILKAYEISPPDYAAKRAAEGASLHGETTPEALLDHVQYFEKQRVKKIHGGLIVMRRSSKWPDGNPRSANWFVIDEMGEIPLVPIGDQLVERFATQDFLATGSDSRLLSGKPRLAPGVVLVQETIQAGRNWKPKVTYVERRAGLVRRLGFDAEIAGIIVNWDGSQDLEILAGVFARQQGLPKKQVIQDFLGLARRLGSLGLISFGIP